MKLKERESPAFLCISCICLMPDSSKLNMVKVERDRIGGSLGGNRCRRQVQSQMQHFNFHIHFQWRLRLIRITRDKMACRVQSQGYLSSDSPCEFCCRLLENIKSCIERLPVLCCPTWRELCLNPVEFWRCCARYCMRSMFSPLTPLSRPRPSSPPSPRQRPRYRH
jgi:hypothetical protein